MKLGRYELIAPIAKGGMAQIFRARLDGPAGFQQFFAIKRILPQFSRDEDFRRLFVNEAKVASLLRHPNIVSVLELGQDDESLYLVMEYVEGIDLHRLLKILAKQDRWLPADLSAYIIAGLLRALAYAHSRTDDQGRPLGIVHRDVTPHNTLLTKEGLVKLADFGIAKAAFTTFKTAQGLTRGKLGYMSPEQIRGAKLTGASDLFTVGIMLLELLTGRLRTEGRSPKELVKETMQGSLAGHPGLKDAPRALAELCRRLLAQKPEHRPTASEALEALASSGWDKDRGRALAAILSKVPVPTPRKPKNTIPAKPGAMPVPSPPVPSEGNHAAATEAGKQPGPPQGANQGMPRRRNAAAADTAQKNEATTLGPPLKPEEPVDPAKSMDDLPTVILDETQGIGQGAISHQAHPRVESPTSSDAAPAAPMEAQPTVILDEEQSPGSPPPPQRPAETTETGQRIQTGPCRLPPWRLGLRVVLGLASLIVLIMALAQSPDHRGPTTGTNQTGQSKSWLPKGRILLKPAKTSGDVQARISLDGQPLPEEAERVALTPGTHVATWLLEGRLCARKNILIEEGKPVGLHRRRSCPPARPSAGVVQPTTNQGTTLP